MPDSPFVLQGSVAAYKVLRTLWTTSYIHRKNDHAHDCRGRPVGVEVMPSSATYGTQDHLKELCHREKEYRIYYITGKFMRIWTDVSRQEVSVSMSRT
jgi:hypothetical protein